MFIYVTYVCCECMEIYILAVYYWFYGVNY